MASRHIRSGTSSRVSAEPYSHTQRVQHKVSHQAAQSGQPTPVAHHTQNNPVNSLPFAASNSVRPRITLPNRSQNGSTISQPPSHHSRGPVSNSKQQLQQSNPPHHTRLGISKQEEDAEEEEGEFHDPRKPVAFETDAHRLDQRQKQIDMGKNTPEYRHYLSVVPVQARDKAKRLENHPVTPNKNFVCSKRGWDGQIRKWRRLLHQYDLPAAAPPAVPAGVEMKMDNVPVSAPAAAPASHSFAFTFPPSSTTATPQQPVIAPFTTSSIAASTTFLATPSAALRASGPMTSSFAATLSPVPAPVLSPSPPAVSDASIAALKARAAATIAATTYADEVDFEADINDEGLLLEGSNGHAATASSSADPDADLFSYEDYEVEDDAAEEEMRRQALEAARNAM